MRGTPNDYYRAFFFETSACPGVTAKMVFNSSGIHFTEFFKKHNKPKESTLADWQCERWLAESILTVAQEVLE